MAEQRFDLIVVGAGPGGYVAAIRAAQLGLRVACVEKEAALGGTCLRVGCIPSKALLDSSEHYALVRSELAAHGIEVGEVRLDLAKLQARKEKVVRTLTGGVRSLFKKHGVVRLQGTARLEAPGVVVVDGADAGRYEADHVLIATGSVPVELPHVPFDGEVVLDSTGALSLAEVPESLLVVGGGAIGLELGSVWARLGSRVTVVEQLEQIVPGADAELAKLLARALGKQGIEIWTRTTVEAVTVRDGRAEVRLVPVGGGEATVVEVAKVLVAVGRRPYTEGLGLEELGVARDERGRIVVDEAYRTNVPGIYAIGDVIPGPMLAHKASEEGIACVERIAGHHAEVDYEHIPAVVYTDPELAFVGKTAAVLEAEGREVRVGTFPWLANGRARAAGRTEGLVKVVADARTDELLGVHVLGPHASELIAEATVALSLSASAEDLALICHAHPTLSEAIHEAALDALGRVIHK